MAKSVLAHRGRVPLADIDSGDRRTMRRGFRRGDRRPAAAAAFAEMIDQIDHRCFTLGRCFRLERTKRVHQSDHRDRRVRAPFVAGGVVAKLHLRTVERGGIGDAVPSHSERPQFGQPLGGDVEHARSFGSE